MGCFRGAFAKLRKTTISFVTSVCPSFCPHGTIRLLPEGLSWNLISSILRKICRNIQDSLDPDMNNIRTLDMQTDTVHLWQYLAELFIE